MDTSATGSQHEHAMHQPDPVLPPLLTGHAIEPPLEPMAEACRRARSAQLGAGDVVWSRKTDCAELALVLEPDVALATALQIVPLAEVTLADALGQLLPPHIAVHHRWPGAVLVNGGLAGQVRAAASACARSEVPRWLVVGFDLRLAHDNRAGEPGDDPSRTSLAEEGAPDVTRSDIVEAFSRHVLAWLNIWNDDGFRPVHERWLFRAAGADEPVPISHKGQTVSAQVLGLDEEGGLICACEQGSPRVLSLLAHVAQIADEDEHA